MTMTSSPIKLFVEKYTSKIYINTSTDDEYKIVSKIIKNTEIRKQMIICFNKIKAKANSFKKSISTSDILREEGNRLFRADKKANALAASRCYTDAILAAPQDSQALALAHANRAASLVEFGYYFDAYCDCALALELGYPKEKHEKILMRQANCSVKMKNFFKLEDVLEKLRDMELSEGCIKQREDFEIQLKIIAELPGNWHQEEPHDYKVQNILVHPKKGRYMTAWKDYQKDDVVLSEKAFAFVPVNEEKNSKICSNCAKQHFIPYPCYCCSKVVYCSQQCKLADEEIHKYECFGHRCDLYDSLGVTYFAMHVLICGLPEFLPELAKCSSAIEIWQKIETIGKSPKKGYPEILALYKNLHLLDQNSMREVALGSIIAANYLVYCTTFSELYSKSTCTKLDWLAVLSALIFRHSVQMIGSAQGSSAVNFMEDSYDFTALADIWTQPQHLQSGLLHGFRDFCINFSGIYPYLSLCNHSCELSLRTNYDGSRLIAKTQRELKKGDEICNSYVLECRNNSKSNRMSELKNLYHFECDCKHCTPEANDEEYLKFHKYLCRNSKCNKMFSPPIDELHWWLRIIENPEILVKCPFCKTTLEVDWFIEFDDLFNVDILNTAQLMEAVSHFKYVVENLYAMELRQYMAYQIVSSFFKTWKVFSIEDVLFKEVTQVIKHWLECIEEQHDVESLMYATTTPYALDLMAEGKFIDFDRKKIRRSFDMLSTEMRTIFENYIKDYIGEKFDDDAV